MTVKNTRKPGYLDFNAAGYSWKPGIDYREEPEHYRVGKGEQGVLICEPYKSEIGQNWRFKTTAIAEASSEKIYEQFLSYLEQHDFVGADMARKYLQMGYTRARRYANYKGGKKYDNQRITIPWNGERASRKKRRQPRSFIKNGAWPKRTAIMRSRRSDGKRIKADAYYVCETVIS